MGKKEDKVSLLLWIKGNKYLLLKRDKDSHQHSEKWGLAGGRFDEGEDKEEALEREVKEETGLSIKGKDYKFLKKYPKDSKDVYVFYLEDEDLDPQEVTLSDEHGNVQLFTYKEILDLGKDAVPTNLEFIKDYKKAKDNDKI